MNARKADWTSFCSVRLPELSFRMNVPIFSPTPERVHENRALWSFGWRCPTTPDNEPLAFCWISSKCPRAQFQQSFRTGEWLKRPANCSCM